ncbi:MAG: hypothetical protein JWR55_770 [Aeromicrobium sp.]|jgi:hypothetical protein|nr:hypothetical protein [Aeromicrobium sp.]
MEVEIVSTSQTFRRRSRTQRRIRRGLLVVAVLAAVAVALGIYAYSKLSSAQVDLNLATGDASRLQSALTSGDQERARTELAQLQANVHQADSELDDPVLSLAAHTPFVGKNVKAVRTITASIVSVADEGLPPLIDIADRINAKTFNPKNGRIDIDALTALTPNLQASSKVISRASSDIQGIDASELLGPLRNPVTNAQEKISSASDVASRASVASRVIPQMLTGKHTYLLMFQNNAEIRATGGLPGAYARLDVNDGAISLSDQKAGGDLGSLPTPAAPLTAEEEVLFTDLLVTDFRDVNFTPDFPRAAEIAASIVERERGYNVDGVLSLDPVTLSYLLEGIGPVKLADGTSLTSKNAVDVLLNEVYLKYPEGIDQDAVFAGATKTIFDKVLSGGGDPTRVLTALTKATTERRVALWSKDEAITSDIDGTAIAHSLPLGDAAGPALGYYLNDATGAKMQYYLSTSLTGSSTNCTDEGVQSYASEMTLRSTAPADASALPESVRGPGYGAAPGSMLMNLYLYGTDDGTIDSVEIDHEETTFTRATQEGRPVVILTIQVDPGQTVTVQTRLSSGKDQEGSTVVDSTPSVQPGASTQTWKSSC